MKVGEDYTAALSLPCLELLLHRCPLVFSAIYPFKVKDRHALLPQGGTYGLATKLDMELNIAIIFLMLGVLDFLARVSSLYLYIRSSGSFLFS